MKTYHFIILFCVFWLLVVLWRLILILDKSENTNDYCPAGKVCMNEGEFHDIMTHKYSQTQPRPSLIDPSYTRERDLRVLNDPLYPALNRADRNSYEGVVVNTINRQLNIPTNTYNDSYRLIAYMVNEEDPTSTKWKLFGRQKDRNKGEFFMVPVDRTIDLKVQITDDIVTSEKLRSIDSLPNEITFKSPLLSTSTYVITELPKASLGVDDFF